MSQGTISCVRAYVEEITYLGKVEITPQWLGWHTVNTKGGRGMVLPPHVQVCAGVDVGKAAVLLSIGAVPVLIIPAKTADFPTLGLLTDTGEVYK